MRKLYYILNWGHGIIHAALTLEEVCTALQIIMKYEPIAFDVFDRDKGEIITSTFVMDKDGTWSYSQIATHEEIPF
jgi:hypothetical protein